MRYVKRDPIAAARLRVHKRRFAVSASGGECGVPGYGAGWRESGDDEAFEQSGSKSHSGVVGEMVFEDGSAFGGGEEGEGS